MPIFSRLVRTLLAWTVGSFRATSRSLGGDDLLGRSAHWSGGRTPGGVTLPNPSYSHKIKHQPTISKTSPSLLKWLLKQQLILFF